VTKIVLTRHGHVDGIDPPRFRGRAELPLTARGKAQAAAVAAEIAQNWKPVAVYTSPMGRCVETGRAIAQACGVTAAVLDDLNDLHYGEWQWRTYEDARVNSPALFAAWMATPHLVRFPGGESLQDIVLRSANALRIVLERHPGTDECVVMVGHDTINRALLLQLVDQPISAYWRIKQTPCCLNEIDIVPGQVSVLAVNGTQHLRGLL
jgi:probable phosphoglycerate mutase